MKQVKKHINNILLLLVILVSIISVQAFADEKKTILLDAGHGGIDGGASKNGVLEKDINLQITKLTKEVLEGKGYRVLMTRETDNGLYTDSGTVRKKKVEDLNNRLKLKAESDTSMFISIHMNMFEQSKYSGAQVWYGDNAQSKRFGNIMQTTLREHLDPSNKRVEKNAKTSYKVLLNNNNIAALIVECGFLSNYEECKKLQNKDYQVKIANAMAEAVDKYFKEVQ